MFGAKSENTAATGTVMISCTKPANFHRRDLDPKGTGSDVIKPHVPQVESHDAEVQKQMTPWINLAKKKKKLNMD